MKKKGTPVLIVLLLILVVAIAGVITFVIQKRTPSKERMEGNEYYGVTGEEQVAIVVNGTISQHQGKKLDGAIYIAYDSVTDSINERFYWDRDTNKMIYALPTEIVETDLSSDSADYRTVDGQLYISLDAISRYTDMEAVSYDSPNRLVIKNQWNGIRGAEVIEDAPVRYKGGIKSPILTDVPAGTQVQVLDESFENWTQVTTGDGYTGYVEKTALGQTAEIASEHVSQVPEYTSITREGKINMVWHQTTSQAANNALGEMLQNVRGINVIAPTWYFLNDTQGGLIDLSSRAYVDTARSMGLEVWAVLNDFDGGIASGDETFAVLKSTASRRAIIQTLMTSVLENGVSGINVDIEKVSEECAPHYLQFIRELSVSCRNNGIVLSIDNYVPKDYSSYYNRKEQGIVADYVVIMGYDEHFSGSEEAGSVASLPFVKEGIERTLLEVPANKVINAIPFYTRIWDTDNNGLVESATYGMDKADEVVAQQGMEKYWDAGLGQNYAEIQTVGGLTQVWLEDERSVEEKMKLIKEYNLAGVAQWKLGFERPAVWDVIANYLQ